MARPPIRPAVTLDEATIDAIAERAAARVIAKLEARGVLEPDPLVDAVEKGGQVRLSPELLRGLVGAVMDSLSTPDQGTVADNLRGLGVMLPADGGLPLHQEKLGPRKR